MGDSITEGWWRYDPSLFSGGTVDRDISGQTTPQIVLRAMVDIVASNGIGFVLASIAPVSLAPSSIAQRPPQRIVELNAWLKSCATARGSIDADYYSAMVGPDGGVRDGPTFDGLHPGTLG